MYSSDSKDYTLVVKCFKYKLVLAMVFMLLSMTVSSCFIIAPESASRMDLPEHQTRMNTEEFFGYFNEEYANELYDLLNDYRQSYAIEPLLRNSELDYIGRVRSAELVFHFARHRLDRSNLTTVVHIDGVEEFDSAIARGYETPELALEAWKRLDHQVENMLYKSFTHVGVAVLEHNDQYYWILVFAQK